MSYMFTLTKRLAAASGFPFIAVASAHWITIITTAAATAISVMMSSSSLTAAASAVMAVSSFTASLGHLLNLFYYFFKHIVAPFHFGSLFCSF